ncbi:hypothetical protein V1523DRAFT_421783 [Lipomyces doorenjongii]
MCLRSPGQGVTYVILFTCHCKALIFPVAATIAYKFCCMQQLGFCVQIGDYGCYLVAQAFPSFDCTSVNLTCYTYKIQPQSRKCAITRGNFSCYGPRTSAVAVTRWPGLAVCDL